MYEGRQRTPTSPDITHMNFFIWGVIKEKAYAINSDHRMIFNLTQRTQSQKMMMTQPIVTGVA
jgi:hypothetical protein